MRFLRYSLLAVAILTAIATTATQTHASVQGVATTGFGTLDTVGSTSVISAETFVEYYIPLSAAGAGTYGVTIVDPPGGPAGSHAAGTEADSGSGWALATADGLLMNLRFDLTQLDNPLSAAEIRFKYIDLDIDPINDPSGFFESTKFSYFDSAGTLNAITGVIDEVSDVPSSSLIGDITASLAPAVPNNTDPFEIVLSGVGIKDIINEIRNDGQDTLYMQLGFGSASSGNATNTSEFLLASSISEIVPEPGTIFVWSLLALSAAVIGCRRNNEV